MYVTEFIHTRSKEDWGNNGEPLVPAFFIFRDSIVDVGSNNNNNLHTLIKANFFPY
jgi:hypothetical protein